MPIEPNGQAPYAPSATVLEVMNRFRDRGLQTPFSLDVLMRAGVTESLAPRTLQALKLLDLIDETGAPTDQFEGLRRAPTDEFQARLEEVLRAAYADVFQFTDPAVDSADRIADAFREYKPPGQRARMVTLFLGLCEAAGIIDEPPKRTRPTRPATRAPRNSDLPPRQTGPGVVRKAPSTDLHGIRPEIAGLLAGLPDPGSGWTKERREQFLQTFSAVLDFVIPIRDDELNDPGTEVET